MAVAAEAPVQNYQFVDDIPEAEAVRLAERVRAEAVLDARKCKLSLGLEEDQPLPIDALSTARAVHLSAAIYGEGSPQHLERLDGLELDCQRLVAEWWRKLRPELFPKIRHTFDRGTEDYLSHGFSARQMTENALTPMPDNPEEEARRVNERVEDETPNILRSIGSIAFRGARIRTISLCTDKALQDYEADQLSGAKHGGYGGYKPECEKLSIRDITIDQETDDRFEEVVMLPGSYFHLSVIKIALARRGLDAEHLDKTGLHGAQILAGDDLLEFVELLDGVASEQWGGANIYMGEEVDDSRLKNYAGFRQEAVDRQAGQKDVARTVANFVWDLAADSSVDPRKAPEIVEEFVKKILLDVGKQKPEIVEDMFDRRTVIGLQEVVRLEAENRFAEAFIRMREVEQMAPGGGYCGAGSCGLERFDEYSKEGKEVKEKLGAEAGDTLLRFTEGTCRACNRKVDVIIAVGPTKINKLCTACGATDFKKTPFRS